jgi:hypothetical protein
VRVRGTNVDTSTSEGKKGPELRRH